MNIGPDDDWAHLSNERPLKYSESESHVVDAIAKFAIKRLAQLLLIVGLACNFPRCVMTN